ncbi:MAG: hypothetical protein ACTSPD_21755 [Promethearchaeota archaeon]
MVNIPFEPELGSNLFMNKYARPYYYVLKIMKEYFNPKVNVK